MQVVPVIMISAKTDEDSIVKALNAGCNDFLTYALPLILCCSLPTLLLLDWHATVAAWHPKAQLPNQLATIDDGITRNENGYS